LTSKPSFMIKRAGLIVVIAAVASLFVGGTAAAQRSDDPRFGLVNAFRAPDAAYSSGASWELITLRWDELQPGGPADWNASAATDQWLGTARTAGREVVAELIGTPAWATDGKAGTGVPRGLYLPASDPNNVWGNFVRQAVSYYGVQGINRWVIWNAPDIPADASGSEWDGTTEDYYQLVKTAYLVVKGSNANSQVHLGAATEQNPAWFNRFLEVVIDDPTAATNDYYFDVASVSVFFSPDQVYTLAANPTFLMDRQGIPLKPVWVNAVNARPGIDPKVYPEDNKFKQHPNISLDQQAAFIVQAYALGFAAGAERIAAYQLADDIENDHSQAFGLVRTDGDPRPAFSAYQQTVKLISGFALVRRVDEQSHPLIEYVRFTSASKVVHVAWARTAQNATLVIPARSKQATLYDLAGNQWLLSPEGGAYRVVVGGAECNDPGTVGGCLIGGMPWFLVEEGVEDPLYQVAPAVSVDPGGTLPTPDPGPFLTATALAMPSPTPTATQPPTEAPTAAPTQEVAAAEPTQIEAAPSEAPAEAVATLAPTPTPVPGSGVGPKGFAAALPYLLVGLGVLAIGGGAWYFFSASPQTVIGASYTQETQEHLPPVFEDDGSAYFADTREHVAPEFPDDDDAYADTEEYEHPDFPDDDAYTADTQEYEHPDFPNDDDESADDTQTHLPRI
jgi:hypothetical protein